MFLVWTCSLQLFSERLDFFWGVNSISFRCNIIWCNLLTRRYPKGWKELASFSAIHLSRQTSLVISLRASLKKLWTSLLAEISVALTWWFFPVKSTDQLFGTLSAKQVLVFNHGSTGQPTKLRSVDKVFKDDMNLIQESRNAIVWKT